MNLEDNYTLPIEVREAYNIEENHRVTRLTGGLVNETLLIEQDEKAVVLRKLAPILGESIVRDTCVISHHLSAAGWEAPNVEPSIDGNLHVYDSKGSLWHASTHITSDIDPAVSYDATLALHAGELIGSWHDTVRNLDYTPSGIPHFHDTDYIAKKLGKDRAYFKDEKLITLGALLIEDFYRQSEIPSDGPQIIHGDPKINNMLFRQGKPFTLVDFDCVMKDSVWTDTGDFLRSISGKLVDTGEDIGDVVDSFVKGYIAGKDSDSTVDEVQFKALQSTRRIACELGMRFLSDIVDGENYFSWDATTYPTRSDALYEKALLQFKVVNAVKDKLNED